MSRRNFLKKYIKNLTDLKLLSGSVCVCLDNIIFSYKQTYTYCM